MIQGWTPEFRREYSRLVKRRRRAAMRFGGVLALAVALASDAELFDPECWDYIQRLHIEFDLFGPKSLMGSSLAGWQ